MSKLDFDFDESRSDFAVGHEEENTTDTRVIMTNTKWIKERKRGEEVHHDGDGENEVEPGELGLVGLGLNVDCLLLALAGLFLAHLFVLILATLIVSTGLGVEGASVDEGGDEEEETDASNHQDSNRTRKNVARVSAPVAVVVGGIGGEAAEAVGNHGGGREGRSEGLCDGD